MPARLRKAALPYLLLLPGLGWLLLFFALPLVYMALESLKTGTIDTGFQLTWEFSNYTNALKDYDEQFIRSFEYAGLATLIALLIGYPLAYVIAFRGGKWRNALLLLVIVPFFVTYLIRTLVVGDDPVRLGHRREHAQVDRDRLAGRAVARHHGLRGRGHHLQLPAVHDPAAVREPRAHRPAAARGGLRPLRRRRDVFLRVTLPLSMPGVVAGALLTFIPAAGDFINAQLLGTPKQFMIGNVIQSRYLVVTDYPTAAALSFLLMAFC